MQNRITETSPRYLVGVTSGTLVLIFFGLMWAGLSLQGLQNGRAWTVTVIAGVVIVALLALGLTTLRAARRLPQERVTPREGQGLKKISRYFSIVCGVEFTASVLLNLFKHPEFIAPVICLIVGLHFLPLAFLFEVRVYTLVGAVLSLLGGGALLALLFGLTLGGLYTWSVIIGLCIAVILWLASLYLLVKVRRVLHLIQQPPAGGRSVV